MSGFSFRIKFIAVELVEQRPELQPPAHVQEELTLAPRPSPASHILM